MGSRRGRDPATALLILLLLGACAPAPESGRDQSCEHVVIVSIDGLRPDFYADPESAPTLTSIAASGARAAAVESVYPSSTYPAHASIVTGVRPAKHGIHANTTWTEQGSSRNWYWYARDLKAKTLWQAAREKGLTVAITYWPTSVGAKADWVLGEIWDPENRETVRRLAAAATPGLLTELALGVGIPQEKIALDRAAIDGFVSRAAAHLFKKHRPNLQLVHLLSVDEAQHQAGPGAPEVKAALRVQDDNIARIRKAIEESGVGPKTALLIVGDHGFTSISRNVGANTILRDAGFLTEEEGRVASWRALTRSSGGSASIYVKDPADLPGVKQALLAASALDGAPRYRVLERPELDALGYNPDAAFALEPADGVAITERLGPSVPTVKGNHGQLPTRPGLQTGFLAEGAGIRAGARIERMRVIDIAPTVAELLGLDLPEAEGHTPPNLLR
ncbi:MAG: alkaline phosphatase family protein [Planctomycetaceae bacterium]|nr:alkaline phosphatase family protein [Planctomycetaceae bacterium]